VESPLLRESDGSCHILSNPHPGGSRTPLIKVILEPIVDRASNAPAVVLRIDPAVEPEFFGMTHPRRLPHLSTTQSYAGCGAYEGVTVDIVLCLAVMIIVQ